jgi:hypothetical protein
MRALYLVGGCLNIYCILFFLDHTSLAMLKTICDHNFISV